MGDIDAAQELVDIFFYGLHMDVSRLAQKGVAARDPRVAFLRGYRIALRRKAILLPADGHSAAGVICRMTISDIQHLYHGLTDYQEMRLPIEVGAATITALCMVHRTPSLAEPIDDDYARALREIYRHLGLSADQFC